MKTPIFFFCLLGLFIISCDMEQNKSASSLQNLEKDAIEKEETKNIVKYLSATSYTGATDYFFQDTKGETVRFRVSNYEEDSRIKVPKNLLVAKEDSEGPPSENLDLVGNEYKLIYGESGDVVEIVPR